LLNDLISFACRINDADKALAFEAEVQAINIGLDIISNQFNNNNLPVSNWINIYSDNQATLQVITKPPLSSSNQSTFIQIFDKLVSLRSSLQFSVLLLWCPEHVGIPENEKVDQLAKNSTEGNPLISLDQQTRTLSNIQQVVRSKFRFAKRKNPIIRNNISLTNLPMKIFNSLSRLERGLSSTIYQLRVGHSPLNDFLFRINKLSFLSIAGNRQPFSYSLQKI
jgi:ribonuclease HI